MNLIYKNIIIIIYIFCFLPLSSQYVFDWSRDYGGNAQDQLTSLTRLSDGNIMLSGLAKDTVDALWLIKITHDGNKLWSNLYSEYPMLHPVKIIECSDKNLLIVGTIAEKDSTASKIWLYKINKNGKFMWEKLYSGSNVASANDIIETQDNGFVIAGGTSNNNFEDPDWYILKIDSLGNYMWDNSFGSSYADEANSVAELFDGSIIVVGYMTFELNGPNRASYSKFSQNGEDLWAETKRKGHWSNMISVINTCDSAFVAVSEYKEKSEQITHLDIKIEKFNIDGGLIWDKEIRDSLQEMPTSIVETFDKGYAIAYTSINPNEYNSGNIGIIALSQDGATEWQQIYKKISEDHSNQIIEDKDNGLVVATSTNAIDIAWNYGILKYKSNKKSDLFFIPNSLDTFVVNNKTFFLDAGITGYKKPQKIDVFINNVFYKSFIRFSIPPSDQYDFGVKFYLTLKSGLNDIKFNVTDYKNYKFTKSLRIYYMAKPSPHW